MTGAATSALSQDEAFARIRLLRSPNIGPVIYAMLLQRFGGAVQALEALPDLGRRGGRQYRATAAETVEREVEAVRKAGAKYLFHDQPDYPVLLGQLDSAPPILIWRGDLALAARPCVAMVGARNASAAAVKLARDFASGLAEAGFTVVSGLARGIDGAAHEGAFPHTVGVIASGIDIAYPPQHADLQERIASEGLLLAEQPPGTEPRGSHFPSRNRIIAGAGGRYAGGRGGGQIGQPHHRAARGRGGARGHGNPRQSARAAQPRLQPPHPRRRGAGAGTR